MNTGKLIEVEKKARLHHPEVVESKAARLGLFEGETFKQDVYFRRKGNNNSMPAERYRVRLAKGITVVTLKIKRAAQNRLEAEENEEIEFELSDAGQFFRFMDYLGFEPYILKYKKSRVYRAGRAGIEINEVTHLGHFAEIEIICDEEDTPAAKVEIDNIITSLGLTEDDIEPLPYTLMLQKTHPARYRFIKDSDLDWPFEEITEES